MQVDENVDGMEPETVAEHEARAELERLLADPQFHVTDRHKAFLKFIVDEYFDGRSDAVKAYTIAVDVFGRTANFDPIADPIVRIEATRLRAALAQYYDTDADQGRVRIQLPRGKYVPVFTKSPYTTEGPNTGDVADDLVSWAQYPQWRTMVLKRRLLLSVIAVCAVVGFVRLCSIQTPMFSEKPYVSIDMTMAGDATDVEADLIRDYLMTALSQFRTLKLAAGDISGDASGKVLRSTAGSLFRPGGQAANAYQVILKYHPAGDERAVWWQIVDPVTGEALRSGVERVSSDGKPEADARRQLIRDLAVRFAGPRGVINGIELSRELAEPTIGNGCILRSVLAVEQRDRAGMRDARTCLDATLLAAPDDPDANAELAVVLLESEQPGVMARVTTRALALSYRAVILAPASDRAAYARMIALFRNGQKEAAFVTGYRAMTLNPNNSKIPAKLGAMLYADGRWAEGSALAAKAGMLEKDLPRDAALTLALDAYRRGDFSEALLRVQRMGRLDSYIANIIELASAGQLENIEAAREASGRLSARRADFKGTFRSDMKARHYSPELIDRLGAGLDKAGLASRGSVAEASPY